MNKVMELLASKCTIQRILKELPSVEIHEYMGRNKSTGNGYYVDKYKNVCIHFTILFFLFLIPFLKTHISYTYYNNYYI